MKLNTYVEVQFYPWFKFYSLLFWGLLMSDNEFETKENKIKTKDKTETTTSISILSHLNLALYPGPLIH